MDYLVSRTLIAYTVFIFKVTVLEYSQTMDAYSGTGRCFMTM